MILKNIFSVTLELLVGPDTSPLMSFKLQLYVDSSHCLLFYSRTMGNIKFVFTNKDLSHIRDLIISPRAEI